MVSSLKAFEASLSPQEPLKVNLMMIIHGVDFSIPENTSEANELHCSDTAKENLKLYVTWCSFRECLWTENDDVASISSCLSFPVVIARISVWSSPPENKTQRNSTFTLTWIIFLETLYCFRWLKEKNFNCKSLTNIQVRVNALYIFDHFSLKFWSDNS